VTKFVALKGASSVTVFVISFVPPSTVVMWTMSLVTVVSAADSVCDRKTAWVLTEFELAAFVCVVLALGDVRGLRVSTGGVKSTGGV
jgi:hypothetical protein